MAGKDLAKQVNEWEYCYCRGCRRIRESAELALMEKGIRCSRCGSYDLEAPGWVICPHQKISAVKCPRAGRGIIRNESGFACTDRCCFRAQLSEKERGTG